MKRVFSDTVRNKNPDWKDKMCRESSLLLDSFIEKEDGGKKEEEKNWYLCYPSRLHQGCFSRRDTSLPFLGCFLRSNTRERETFRLGCFSVGSVCLLKKTQRTKFGARYETRPQKKPENRNYTTIFPFSSLFSPKDQLELVEQKTRTRFHPSTSKTHQPFSPPTHRT